MNRVVRMIGLVAAYAAGPAVKAQVAEQPAPAVGPVLPKPPSSGEPRHAFGIARTTEIDPAGQTLLRRGLIGSMPVAGGMELGLGLYSVTGNKPRPPESRRNWTVREITPREERIAAVGVKLRF